LGSARCLPGQVSIGISEGGCSSAESAWNQEVKKKKSIMNLDLRSGSRMIRNSLHCVRRACPAENPIRFVGAHIDTTVAHLGAEVLVPVRAVKCMADLGEERSPWDTGEHVAIFVRQQVALDANVEITVPHVFGRIFIYDGEVATWCGG